VEKKTRCIYIDIQIQMTSYVPSIPSYSILIILFPEQR